MKKTFFIFTLGLISITQVLAKKIDGYFITNSHDTMRVVFNIPVKFFSQTPNFESIQYKIKFFDKTTGKKFTLRPDEALEVGFTYENEPIRMLSRGNFLGTGNSIFNMNSKIFLLLEIDGPMKMFHYYYTQSTPGMYGAGGMMTGGYSYSVEQYIMQRGDEALKRPRAWSFKKDMIEYFQDCPALVERIESKEFRKNEVEAIVTYYNLNCQ